MSADQLADEIGVTPSQVLTTIRGNGLPFTRVAGTYVVDPEVAEHIRTLYRNAGPSQEGRPTPEHLREEFTRQERRDIADDTPREHS